MLMISKFFGTKNHLAGMLAVVFLLSSGIFLQARESETQKTNSSFASDLGRQL